MTETPGSADPATDADVDALAAEAEHGYDVAELLGRRAGRPSMGSGAAAVESVRLDPELKAGLLAQAAAEGTSVSEVIRRALRAYVQRAG